MLHSLVLLQMPVAYTATPKLPEALAIISARNISPAEITTMVVAEVAVKATRKPTPPKKADVTTPSSPIIPDADSAQVDAPDTTSRSVENYYTSDEVDILAALETEWPITVSKGQPTGLYYEVKLSIWVNAEGRLERLEILDLKPDEQSVRSAVEAMVGIMVQPALRNGLAVPSQRTIELLLPQ
jgi:hypothetical protein